MKTKGTARLDNNNNNNNQHASYNKGQPCNLGRSDYTSILNRKSKIESKNYRDN